MKLTKKFWAWVSQVFALVILLCRADIILELVKIIPHADLSQLYPEIAGLAVLVGLWLWWLVWRGYEGFIREKDFLFDLNDHRW